LQGTALQLLHYKIKHIRQYRTHLLLLTFTFFRSKQSSSVQMVATSCMVAGNKDCECRLTTQRPTDATHLPVNINKTGKQASLKKKTDHCRKSSRREKSLAHSFANLPPKLAQEPECSTAVSLREHAAGKRRKHACGIIEVSSRHLSQIFHNPAAVLSQ
jgi:hypothetical protein